MLGKKPEKITAALFVYARFSGGGLETRIAEQVRVFREHGVKSYLFCHSCSEEYQGLFDGIMDGMTCCEPDGSAQLLCEDVMWNVKHMAKFCQQHKVSYIDCHPFWGVVPATLTGTKLGIPVVYTAHGVDSAEFYQDNLCRIFLRYGLSEVFIVGEYLRERAEQFATCPVQLAPNGITFTEDYITTVAREGKWALASRLDQSKTKLIIDFLPILKQSPIKQLDIYGDGVEFETLKKAVQKAQLTERVKFQGWHANIPEVLLRGSYDGVIGMGRVALESMMLNLPTVILGYGGIYGGVTADNLDEVLYHNFTSWKVLDQAAAVEQIQSVCSQAEKYQIRSILAERAASEKIWGEYLAAVEQLSPANPAFLHGTLQVFKQNPKLDLLSSVELATMLGCVLGDELLAVKDSTSWRLTQPLRQAKARFQQNH